MEITAGDISIEYNDDNGKRGASVSIVGRFDYQLYFPFFKFSKNAPEITGDISIDLSRTNYLDSSALGLLLLLKDVAHTRIRLLNPAPDIARTLATANFDKIFMIE